MALSFVGLLLVQLTTGFKLSKAYLQLLKILYIAQEGFYQFEEVDPESQKSLDKKIEQVSFDKEALGNTSALIARNIPPYNSSASTPVEACPLNKIILKGDWEFLGDIYKILQVGAEVASNVYPHFVCNRIHKLDAIQVRV